ncbi:unnamed protein product [Polarella glacialis]|uniref:Secreted protein n=1 Tax=Polarella glacialis TaxID=89957 RepID=A0A813LA61_POLGL|nr:unnamed protein product [Polarella glacialis]
MFRRYCSSFDVLAQFCCFCCCCCSCRATPCDSPAIFPVKTTAHSPFLAMSQDPNLFQTARNRRITNPAGVSIAAVHAGSAEQAERAVACRAPPQRKPTRSHGIVGLSRDEHLALLQALRARLANSEMLLDAFHATTLGRAGWLIA